MRRNSVLFILGLLLPLAVSANGGIKEVAEGKYMVQLSSAPIAPFVGEMQNNLIAVADIYGNLIQKEISMDLTLKYQHEPILEKKNLTAKNGVLPFQYIYDAPGLYELFVAFRLPDELDHTYMPEDFMIDVKEKYAIQSMTPLFFFGIVGGSAVGFLLGVVVAKK